MGIKSKFLYYLLVIILILSPMIVAWLIPVGTYNQVLSAFGLGPLFNAVLGSPTIAVVGLTTNAVLRLNNTPKDSMWRLAGYFFSALLINLFLLFW